MGTGQGVAVVMSPLRGPGDLSPQDHARRVSDRPVWSVNQALSHY
jgi:hypothetical protein